VNRLVHGAGAKQVRARDRRVKDWCVKDWCVKDWCVKDWCVKDWCVKEGRARDWHGGPARVETALETAELATETRHESGGRGACLAIGGNVWAERIRKGFSPRRHEAHEAGLINDSFRLLLRALRAFVIRIACFPMPPPRRGINWEGQSPTATPVQQQ